MLTLLAMLTQAFAVPPTDHVASFDIGSSTVLDGASSSGGDTVAFVNNGGVAAISVDTWESDRASPCDVNGVAVVPTSAGEDEVWVGCETGSVLVMALRDGELVVLEDEDGEQVRNVIVEGSVEALFYDEERGDVVAVVEADGQAAHQILKVDPSDLSVSLTIGLPTTDYVTSAIGEQFLFVIHRDAVISSHQLAGSTATVNTSGLLIDVVDLAPTSNFNQTFAMKRGSSGLLALYDAQTRAYTTLIASASGLQAIGATTDLSDAYTVLAYDDRIQPYQGSSGLGTPLEAFSIDFTARDVLPVASGYTFVGTTAGTIEVLTHRPWVSDVELSARSVVSGDVVDVDFVVDRAGDWEVVLGGSRTSGGQVLGSGTAEGAGAVSTELTVGDWSEGDLDVFVRLTDDDGVIGHGHGWLTVDTEPDTVVLDDSSVGIDDEFIRLTFEPLEAEDIEGYDVYVTTTPFDSDTYATGGPSYEGPDADIASPVRVEPGDGDAIEVTFSPVTNGVTYYLAVRAIDTGGLEGAMSDVVEAIPEPTLSATDLAGETGTTVCGTTGGAGLGLLGLLGALGALGARRRRLSTVAAAAAAGALGSSLLLAGPARAQDAGDPDEDTAEDDADAAYRERVLSDRNDKRGDDTPAWAKVELRYGRVDLPQTNNPSDNPFAAVHGDLDMFELRFGPQFFRVLELDFGLGLIRSKDNKVRESDITLPGTSEARTTLAPMSVGATARLHLLDEQFFVPYGQLGYNFWPWWERADTTDPDAPRRRAGHERGMHWAVGGQILLDTFDRDRASLLEAQTNINDTWLYFEYRRQTLDNTLTEADTQGFDFSARVFSVGLKLDI